MTTLAASMRMDARQRRIPPQTAFILRRLRRFVLSVLVVVGASFAMLQMIPGDPVRTALGADAPESLVVETRHQLGLDHPAVVQLWEYVRGVAVGDFGTSIASRQPVSDVIAQRLPGTLALTVVAFAVTIIIAVPMGLAAGVLFRERRHPVANLVFTGLAGLLGVVPEFLLAVGLVFVFAVTLPWLPVAGADGPASYVLPVAALTAAPIAVIARLVRVETAASLREGYVQTARAKRLAPSKIYLKHVLPNALTSTLTVGGLLFGGLIAGTVLVENVFAWPGLGSTMVSAITGKDYPVVQAIVLIYGVGVLIVNLIIDLLLAWLNPRSSILER